MMEESIAKILSMLLETRIENLPLRGKILLWSISLSFTGISLCCLVYAIGYLIHSLQVWFGG